jgi:hypothetical protein
MRGERGGEREGGREREVVYISVVDIVHHLGREERIKGFGGLSR